MSTRRAKAAVKELRRLLESEPLAFMTDEVCAHIERLINLVKTEEDRLRSERAVATLWHRLPVAQQDLARNRQRVAVLVLCLEMDGMTRESAVREIARVSGLSFKGFRAVFGGFLRDDWLALRRLGCNARDFLSLRQIQLWAEAEEAADRAPHARPFPLYLVDREVLLSAKQPMADSARRA